MADKKISQLPAATTPLAGTEELPIVQSGVTDKVTVANLTAGRSVSVADLTATTGNLVIGTSGKGIDFSATPQPAGMTSELLADYEEGTFTPTVAGESTAGTYVPSMQQGRYVKIGRVVYWWVKYVNGSVTTPGTGNLLLKGLPYTISSEVGVGPSMCYHYATPVTAGNVAALVPTGGGTNMYLLSYDAAGGQVVEPITRITNGSYLVGFGSYLV